MGGFFFGLGMSRSRYQEISLMQAGGLKLEELE